MRRAAAAFFLCWCLALALATIFTVDNSLVDSLTLPKWLVGGWVLAAGLTVLSLSLLAGWPRLSRRVLLRGGGTCVLVACALESLLVIAQDLWDVPPFQGCGCGSFDNAAGASSCLALGMAVPVAAGGKRWRATSWLLRGLCVAGIVATRSRLAMVCAVLMVAGALRLKARVALPLAAMAFVMLAVGVKGESSKGRWLIYSQTAAMIAERPLAGWGSDGFRAHYMHRQAHHFREHPGSRYARVADNVRHPLSDVLWLGVSYGVPAVLVAVLSLGGLVAVARRERTDETRGGFRILSCLLLLCLFSYPMRYPFSWAMLLYALLCLLPFRLGGRWTGAALLPPTVVLCLCLRQRTTVERRWRTLAARAERLAGHKVLADYAALHPSLASNPFFLYNEAAVLYEAGAFGKAGRVADECGRRLADYDLQLLRGDISLAMGDHGAALQAYREAGWMIPSRIMPRYAEYRVYGDVGDGARRDSMRRVILRFHPKVDNATVRHIKKRVAVDAL